MEFITGNSFDEITDFVCGEDKEFIVEYLLFDNNGFCHRACPFLMPIGTVFEHNYGTYKVTHIYRQINNIVVHCERIDSKHKNFDFLFQLKETFN